MTSRTEHKAVLDACRQLEREGFAVTYLKPDADGIVEPEQVAERAAPGHAARLADAREQRDRRRPGHRARSARSCRERGVLLHVDAAQSVGKLPLDVAALTDRSARR